MTEPARATDGSSGAVAGHGDAERAGAVGHDLAGILDTIDLPVIALNRDFSVGRFNRAAAIALDLTPSHVGQSLRGIGVFGDAADLEKSCAQVVADGVPRRRELRHEDRWYLIRIAPTVGGEAERGMA